MNVILIAVMATNRVIGRDNTIPWHIPEELRFFKKTTMGFPVVMGRLTYESLKGPLPGRQNIVISRNPDYQSNGTDNVTSLEQALKLTGDAEKAFILGGSQIFEEALPSADEIILSVLDREVEGDVYFPDFSDDDFQQTHHERHEEGKEPFTVYYYKRIPPAA
ncbi:dihydrofolate reductase [Desulfopila aestuarii]|uniref:Dihydrofolate reductase n=1 Tax=Desulfopila aestuarii DSM 18488 TaxID=1121416 RepID=A0A1M7Y6V7_9BACT|nr:dihydrofolate reductase [Desulfopila aestuarii]SHO48334.1 dihydrofolate reductase [Desulfopila aestuarii DSM 18488]